MHSTIHRFRVLEELVVTCLILLFLVAKAGSGAIVGYEVTSVVRAELSRLPPDHWAQYRSLCSGGNGAKKIEHLHLLNRSFERITEGTQRYPFYAWDSSLWYVSAMGFLSPTPYGMCDGYCPRRFFADIRGTYAFSSDTSVLYEGGGDWPMIGLYVTTPDEKDTQSLKGFIMTLDSSEGNTFYTTVEYCHVNLSDQQKSAEDRLTAQVILYADGTVIMRYASLPDSTTWTRIMPSTGLIYSKTLREIVPTPTVENDIVAYRFAPRLDACADHADAEVCTADTRSDCVWCSSTSVCSQRSFVAEVCPRGQWSPPTPSEPMDTPQKFYHVQIDYKTPFVTVPDNPTPFPLNKEFFFFRLARGTSTAPFFKSRSFPSIFCIPGLSCFTQGFGSRCEELENTCVNGNYSMSILALESRFVFSNSAHWVSAQLPQRRWGDLLCDEMGGCTWGFVGQLSGAVLRNSSSSKTFFSVQLYVDLSGVIDVTIVCKGCVTGEPLLAYPPIRVGLIRHGVDDPSSVMVPQGLIRSGLHVRFIPRTACPDCGADGWCDESLGLCRCRPGHYGNRCKPCPVCWTGSVCSDGISGSGHCVCNGGACKEACPLIPKEAIPVHSCAHCSPVGGTCNCGVCECQGGWSGLHCDVAPVDVCRAYSFDGCEVCGQHEGCVFCHDSTCFNPALSGTSHGYVCSYSTPAADTEACATYRSRGLQPTSRNSINYIAMIGLPSAISISLFALVFFVVLMCRERIVPNRMATYAVLGATEFRNLQRERQVVHVAFTRERMPDRGIMGIPLKQISLLRLFKRRKEAAVGAASL